MGNQYRTAAGTVVTLAQDKIEDLAKAYRDMVKNKATSKEKVEWIKTKAELNNIARKTMAVLLEENGCEGMIEMPYGKGIYKEPKEKPEKPAQTTAPAPKAEPAAETAQERECCMHQDGLARVEIDQIAVEVIENELVTMWHLLQADIEREQKTIARLKNALNVKQLRAEKIRQTLRSLKGIEL